jgi:hypothetical protein
MAIKRATPWQGVSNMSTSIESNQAASNLLEDALSSVARSTRRNLIVLSTLCWIVSSTGINPSNFSFPFFKIENLSEIYIVYGLLGFTIFSFVSFFAHAISDFLRFKHKKDVYDLAIARQIDNEINTPPDLEQKHVNKEFEGQTGYKSFFISYRLTSVLYFIKIVLDFIFPVIYGVISILMFTDFVF